MGEMSGSALFSSLSLPTACQYLLQLTDPVMSDPTVKNTYIYNQFSLFQRQIKQLSVLGLTLSVCSAPLTGHRSQRVELQDFCFTHTLHTAILLSFSDTLKYCQTSEAILASLFCRAQRKVSCILRHVIGSPDRHLQGAPIDRQRVNISRYRSAADKRFTLPSQWYILL